MARPEVPYDYLPVRNGKAIVRDFKVQDELITPTDYVDGVTIQGTGAPGDRLRAVGGAIAVVTDGTTISGDGTAGNALAVIMAGLQIGQGQVTNLVADLTSLAALIANLQATKVPTARIIATSAPLVGGGDLSVNRTLSVMTFDSVNAGVVPASGGGSENALYADGVWRDPSSPAAVMWFGDGSDGNATISINTGLSRDMFYENLTVNAGIRLDCNGYRVYVRTLLTLAGLISDDGANGTNAVGSAAGVGGAARAAGVFAANIAGGNGGGGGGAFQGASSGASNAVYYVPGLAMTGGGGGTAGTPAGANNGGNGNSPAFMWGGGGGGGSGASSGGLGLVGGGRGAPTQRTAADGSNPRNVYIAEWGRSQLTTIPLTQGSGGGGGGGGRINFGGDQAGGGGGGGASGGQVFVAAYRVLLVAGGGLSARGGNAGNGGQGTVAGGGGSVGGGGGGGGGPGGRVALRTSTSKAALSGIVLNVAGGLGGAGGLPFGAGAAGSGGNGGNATSGDSVIFAPD